MASHETHVRNDKRGHSKITYLIFLTLSDTSRTILMSRDAMEKQLNHNIRMLWSLAFFLYMPLVNHEIKL